MFAQCPCLVINKRLIVVIVFVALHADRLLTHCEREVVSCNNIIFYVCCVWKQQKRSLHCYIQYSVASVVKFVWDVRGWPLLSRSFRKAVVCLQLRVQLSDNTVPSDRGTPNKYNVPMNDQLSGICIIINELRMIPSRKCLCSFNQCASASRVVPVIVSRSAFSPVWLVYIYDVSRVVKPLKCIKYHIIPKSKPQLNTPLHND